MSATQDEQQLSNKQPSELTFDQIDVSASVEQIVEGFVPIPRFSQVSFENYRPDPNQPSQSLAVERLREFVGSITVEAEPKRNIFGFRPKQVERSGTPGLYLDGGFGVGKTHLLAASYFEAPAPKAYLSFEELTYTIGAMGMQASLSAFSKYRLICVDEFELDDVGNTMLVKTFTKGVTQGPTRIITTSNTLPSELGEGRFAAEDFKREIGEIASTFEIARIEGDDYRHCPRDGANFNAGQIPSSVLQEAYHRYVPESQTKLYTTFAELCRQLALHHPIHYAQLLYPLEMVFIDSLNTIENQTVALRFRPLYRQAV